VVSGLNTANPTVDPTLSNQFTLKVIYGASVCLDSLEEDITITISDTSGMLLSPVDTTVCYGSAVNLFAQGGTSYQWEPVDLFFDPTLSNVALTAYENKSYSVQITDAFGCSATKNGQLKVENASVDAGIEQVIRYGQAAQLNANGDGIISWFPSPNLSALNIPNPLASPLTDEWFYAQSTTNLGCTAMDSVLIKVSNAIIPNAFTPNGDGRNDIFKLYPANDEVRLLDLSIYNRWGQRLFNSSNVNEGWNGTYKGELQKIDVYFYRAEFSIGAKNYIYQGDVNLLR